MASQDIKEGPSISCENIDEVYGQSTRGTKEVKPVFPVSVSLIIEKEASGSDSGAFLPIP
jgi:hypothetical protein